MKKITLLFSLLLLLGLVATSCSTDNEPIGNDPIDQTILE